MGISTIQEISSLPDDTPSYKTVGRMFVKGPLPDLRTELKGMLVQVEDQIKNLEGP